MSKPAYSLERDLKEAETMVRALDPYIYQETLYAKVGGGGIFSGQMPALTLGTVLLRLRRLRVLYSQLSPAQQTKLAEIETLHVGIFKEWRNHYEGKLIREANSRLDDLQAFFEECREDPRLCANVYLPEALRRTLVQEILIKMEEAGMVNASLAARVKVADSELRRHVKPGEFLWDAVLQPAYPQTTFWWLYGKPG